MMEEEEETLFDQEGLLRNREDSPSRLETTQRKRKIFKTAALSMAFFSLGVCIAIPGSTIQELGLRVKEGITRVAFIFTARAFGYLVGSVMGGVLFDLFDQQIMLFYTLAAAAVATVVVPWCDALMWLSLMIGVHGIAIGVIDSGGNVFCIKIWGKRSPAYMQMLHFAFGLGAFLAPLLVRPFVNDKILSISNSSSHNSHPVNPGLTGWIPGRSKDRQSEGGISQSSTDLGHLSKRAVSFDDFYSFKAHLEKRDVGQNSSMSETPTPTNVSSVEFSLNATDVMNYTTIQTTPTTSPPPLPKKPSVINGEHLKKDSADGSKENSKIQKLKDNPIVLPPKDEPTPTTLTTSTGNITSVNDTEIAADSLNVTAGKRLDNGQSNDNSSTSSELKTTVAITPSTTTTVPTTEKVTTAMPITTKITTIPTTTKITTPIPTTTKSSTTTTTTSTTEKASPSTTTATITTSTPFFTSGDSQSDIHKPGEAIDLDFNTTSINGTSTPRPDFASDIIQAILDTIRHMSRIQFAYLILGLMLLLNAGIFLFLYCKDKFNITPLYVRSHEDLTRPPDSKSYVCSLLSLLFCFFFVYVGMEVTFGGLITKFAHAYPKAIWTNAEAVMLDAVFWGSIAVGRGVSIFLAYCFKPPCMMVLNLILTIAGSSILSFGIFTSPILLWVGTAVLGIGMSSIFPTIISWANSYYPLSGKSTAVFVAGSAVGEMIVPWLTSYLYDAVMQMALMYMTLTLSVLLTLLFIVLQLIASCKKRATPKRSHSGFVRLQDSEDMADALDMDMIESPRSAVRLRRHGEENNQNGIHSKSNGADVHDVTEFSKLVDLSD